MEIKNKNGQDVILSDLAIARQVWWKHVRRSALDGLLPLTVVAIVFLSLFDLMFSILDWGEIIFMIFGLEPLLFSQNIEILVCLFIVLGCFLALVPYVYTSVGAYPRRKHIEAEKELRAAYAEYVSGIGESEVDKKSI